MIKPASRKTMVSKGLFNNYQEWGRKMSLTKKNITQYPPLNKGKLALTPPLNLPKIMTSPPFNTTTYKYSKYT